MNYNQRDIEETIKISAIYGLVDILKESVSLAKRCNIGQINLFWDERNDKFIIYAPLDYTSLKEAFHIKNKEAIEIIKENYPSFY